MTKKALVTGAGGFIGRHLCRSLLNAGYSVRGTRIPGECPEFAAEEKLEWVECRIENPECLKGLCSGVDTVYHLAAIPRNNIGFGWEQFETINVGGTRNLLREAAGAGIRRFVFVSTVEAAGYGDGTNPRRENDDPHPCNNYGKSKLLAEELVMKGNWEFETTTIRLPMIYGPGTFLIVPKLFGAIRTGFYPLIGSGETLMEFCYVGNAVHGIRLCGEHPDAAGELFYVSDERSYSIKEVASRIAESMDRKVRFISLPVWVANLMGLTWELLAKIFPFPPVVSPYSRKAFFTRETVSWTTKNVNIVSIDKISTVLGYETPFGIADGCRQTTKWLVNHNYGKSGYSDENRD